MPTARESLLDAAGAALAGLPWSLVRMIDVAAVAGVSRQTLYNEFGTKDGLARALVRREADAYLAGVDRALREAGIEAVAEWTVTAAAPAHSYGPCSPAAGAGACPPRCPAGCPRRPPCPHSGGPTGRSPVPATW